MRHGTVLWTLLLVSVGRSFALDWDWQVSAGAGAALAIGADLSAQADGFAASVGAAAMTAPTAAASADLSTRIPIAGALGLSAGLSAQRLGYAFWAPSVDAYSYTALWAVCLSLGLRCDMGPWRLGAGGLAAAPVSGLDVSTHVPGLELDVPGDVSAGKAYALGCYAAGGLAPWGWRAIGALRWRPSAELRIEAWPLGFVDGVDAWQVSATALVGIDMKRGGAR